VSISIILASRNGAATIGEAIDSLVAQAYDGPWEILLADNGSIDGTADVFRSYAVRHPHIPMRIVRIDQPGKSHALNVGIAEASGDRLLFIDDDDTVAPGWLAAMAAAMERAPFVAARMDVETLNPEWLIESRGNNQSDELPVLRFAPYCRFAGGATLGMHRSVFERVGSFDTGLTALEDNDFCIRAHLKGYRLILVPDAVYRYRFRSDAEAIERQGYAYGRARALLRRRYADKEWRFSPMRWLGIGVEFAHMALHRSPSGPAGDGTRDLRWGARRAIQRGALRGDLAGAMAYGVPPSRAHADALRNRLSNLFRRTTRFALEPLYGATVSVRTDRKLLALTFDDGPDPASTPALLDALAAVGARATFFVIGARAERHPELVARILAEGHEIGNHTWDHPSLPTLPIADQEAQLRRARDQLQGAGDRLMRPPYGDHTLATARLARRLGYRMVLWNSHAEDWRDHDAETIASRICDEAAPGAIALLHDTLYSFENERCRDRGPVTAAVKMIVERLPDYGFVTVSELLAAGAPVRRMRLKTSTPEYLRKLVFASDAPAAGKPERSVGKDAGDLAPAPLRMSAAAG